MSARPEPPVLFEAVCTPSRSLDRRGMKAVALLLLGASPFVVRAIPARVLPRTLGPGQMLVGSMVCMMLMLVAGVTGPLLDTLFLRSPLERRQIVATKAACQVFSHGLKLVYFGALIDQAGSVEPWLLAIAVAASMIGTSLGKLLLERLTDTQFRAWSNRIHTNASVGIFEGQRLGHVLHASFTDGIRNVLRLWDDFMHARITDNHALSFARKEVPDRLACA